MPVTQTAANVQVVIKVQSALGTPATGSGGTGFNVKPGNGITLQKQTIPDQAVRRDGQSKRARQGSYNAMAVYPMQLAVGTHDMLWEALIRGTWVAQASLSPAQFTSLTTTTSTIVAAAAVFLTTAPVRIGDQVQLTTHSTASNNGKWLRVLGVTGTVITVPTGSLVTDAVADTTVNILVARTISMGTSPTERYFTIEDNSVDIDVSEYATDMKVTKVEFNAQPNQTIEVTWTFMGLNVTPLTGVSSPNLTAPTYSTTLPLVMKDGTIRIAGVDQTVLTGFQWSYDLKGQVPDTLSDQGPDVFNGNGVLTGSMSALRQDSTFLNAFKDETTVSFFINCQERVATGIFLKPFISFYFGDCIMTSHQKGIAAEGPMVETLQWAGGIDETGGASTVTTIKIATSA